MYVVYNRHYNSRLRYMVIELDVSQFSIEKAFYITLIKLTLLICLSKKKKIC